MASKSLLPPFYKLGPDRLRTMGKFYMRMYNGRHSFGQILVTDYLKAVETSVVHGIIKQRLLQELEASFIHAFQAFCAQACQMKKFE